MTGYRHPVYARSLRDIGDPRHLPRSGGWILERPIGVDGLRDAMGTYPLFDCRNWSGLPADLEELGGRMVSVTVVPDPLAGFGGPDALREAFRDLVRPFKTHYVRDLSRPVEPSRHHRRNVRRALERGVVERCDDPSLHLDEWATLYAALVDRHDIEGPAAFSRRAFEKQLRVPGIEAFRARREGTTVGMTLWYVGDGRAHYHLGAYDAAGYELGASFALFQVALEHLRERGVLRVDLGGGAGLEDDPADGLARFKRGWATGTRKALLCGRILDPGAYGRLAPDTDVGGYFPAYRAREFE